jgi:adenylate cyclase
VFLTAAVAALVYGRVEAEITARTAELAVRSAVNTAERVEKALDAARADALTLLELNGGHLPAEGAGGSSGARQAENDRFFKLRPLFAAILSSSGERIENRTFFLEHDLTGDAAGLYLSAERELVERAAVMESPDAVLLGNASPYFGAPVTALFFRDSQNSVVAAFFSTDAFTPLLGDGAERVFVVNHRDDIILHTDAGIVMSGENYWQDPLVRLMRNSASAGAEAVFNSGGGSGAFQKLRTAGADAAALCGTPRGYGLAGLRQAMREGLALCGAAGGLVIIFSFALSFSMRRYIYNTFVEQEREIAENLRLKSIFRALPGSLKSDRAVLEKTPLSGENRDVTVVFAGLHGKAAIKDLSPQRTLNMLNAALMLIQDSFAKTGGAADKVSGDSLTGVWGAPFSDGSAEMDSLHAIRGALMVRAAFLKSGGAKAGQRLTVSCGISSGVMLAGRVGAEEDSVYTFTGSAARQARLLELHNKRFGTDILIGESTMALAGKYFITEEMPPVKVRGLQKPLRVFAVINVRVTKKGMEQPKPANMAELRQLLEAAAQPAALTSIF